MSATVVGPFDVFSSKRWAICVLLLLGLTFVAVAQLAAHSPISCEWDRGSLGRGFSTDFDISRFRVPSVVNQRFSDGPILECSSVRRHRVASLNPAPADWRKSRRLTG